MSQRAGNSAWGPLPLFLMFALVAGPLAAISQDQSPQSQPDQSQQNPAQPDQSQPAETVDTQSPQSQAPQTPAPQTPNKQQKEIKKGSEQDVTTIGDRGIGKGVNFYSLDKEMALGKMLAQQVMQQSRMIEDPVVTEYVNRIGQNIVRNSDAQVPFTIKVIDDDTINAFALPGGFFFVQSGLILAADTEAELAGVMAHEIAHVAARHGTRNATKAELANWLTLPLIFVGGPAGYGVRSATSLLLPLKFLQFSRDQEREADYLGLQYLYKTGYDPQAFVDFFEKIQAREKSRSGALAKAFSTHPMTPDRITAAQNEMNTILPPRPEYMVTSSEFDQVVARLRVLENRGRLEEAKDDVGRPTLRKRTTSRTTDTGSSGGSTTGTSSDDSGRPTLKRAPGESTDSGTASSPPSSSPPSSNDTGSANAGSTEASTAPPPDTSSGDDRPTLRRAPSADSTQTQSQ